MASAHSWGSGCPLQDPYPPLLLALRSRECLTLPSLISNPLTFISAPLAWCGCSRNVKPLLPLVQSPGHPLCPQQPTSLSWTVLGEGRVLL